MEARFVIIYLYGTHLSEIGMPHISIMYALSIIYKCFDYTTFCRIIQIQKKDLRGNQKSKYFVDQKKNC